MVIAFIVYYKAIREGFMSISIIQSGFTPTPILQPKTQQYSSNYQAATENTTTQQRDTASNAKAENIAAPQETYAQQLLSTETQSVLLSQQEAYNPNSTSQELDELFSNTPNRGHKELGELPALLMPSAENIAAISKHVSSRFKQMLREYDIPSAPETITYNDKGKMQLPADYEYADELENALKENPGIERELSTVNALTSVYVELQKLIPFHEEYAAARSQAQIDSVINKYSHLFNGNRQYSSIALHFSNDGALSLTANENPVSLT